ncbi:glycosyltransferase family 2 protein, partial [Pediococcus ethanolidurans]|uniref:glycosyltransferase n=1 Tax=Pediococcus ethanolidurans TaxID=319653 RepID=UPI00384E1397|nr:glycosyltransferase family 2 protein [Pediococcus ethanolidurans]
MSVNIGALIVTFNPEIDLLIRNIESVTNQVDKIIIVDNGSRNIDDFSLKIKSLASVIELKRNKGI